MRRALALIPPPLLFVVPLLATLKLHALHPVALTPVAFEGAARIAGSAFVLFGAFFTLGAVAIFVRRRTTIVPHRRARALVTTGPFRWSRNPMYVGLSALYLGVTILAGSAWPLVALVVPIAILRGLTIPKEERIMREVFGASYDAYAVRVRRWL